MIENEIEDLIFSNFIQKEIRIHTLIDGKDYNLKKGRLINFKIKMPFLYFEFMSKNKIRVFPLPIPFSYRLDDRLLFSYRVENMCDDKNMVDKLIKLGDNTESKIFNRIVYVEATS